MEHIIKKQSVHLVLNRKLDAFRIQQQVSERYWNDVLPALEQLFDEITTEDETLYVAQLEVNLGTLTEGEVSRTTWSDDVLGAITKQVREQLTAAPGTGPTPAAQANPVSICQQWLFYVEKGYLPWNTRRVDDAWRRQVLEGLAVDYTSVATLRKLIDLVPFVARRIVQQHTEAFLVHLLAILTSGSMADWPTWLDELETVMPVGPIAGADGNMTPAGGFGNGTFRGGDRHLLWQSTLQIAARTAKKTSEKQLVRRVLETLVGHPDNLPPITLERTARLPRLLPVIRAWKKKAPALATKDRPATNAVAEPSDPLGRPPVSDETVLPQKEEVFVTDAGLVLLHPFLSTLFGRLQLTEDRQFVSLATQQKALYLLHYLATGEPTAEEYQLLVPKLLCVYPLQRPVVRGELLSAEETEEADHLLEEAIRRWDALKSTSADGFRQGFLQRRGKLFSKDENEYLLVETHAIDALLDYLPWNLSMIKLPWMKKLLRVEWR